MAKLAEKGRNGFSFLAFFRERPAAALRRRQLDFATCDTVVPENAPELHVAESGLPSRLEPIFLRYLDGIVSNPPREGLPGFTALLLCTVTGERIHNRVDEQTQILSSFEPKRV